MPGGLVEEAALRREVFLVNDGDKFMSLAGQYLNRFPKSPYAESFFKTFTTTLIWSAACRGRRRSPEIDARRRCVSAATIGAACS